MQYCNGSWCFINIYIRNYFYSINTDVLLTSCHSKNFSFQSNLFEFVALLPSSLVTVIIISMFEQFFTLFHYGTNRLLILSFIIVWLSATVPHSRFVMCYFNRLSGIYIYSDSCDLIEVESLLFLQNKLLRKDRSI